VSRSQCVVSLYAFSRLINQTDNKIEPSQWENVRTLGRVDSEGSQKENNLMPRMVNLFLVFST